MKIEAAVVQEAGQPFEIQQLELDEPRGSEVLVRIVGVGVCHTDIVGQAGGLGLAFPAVFGHEGAGIVEAIGPDVHTLVPGDRVVLSFLSCGHCRRCDQHRPALCQSFAPLNFSGVRADGSATIRKGTAPVTAGFFGQSAFATHALASERNAVRVTDDVPLALLGPLGCGVQTGAGAVMRSLACQPQSSLLILGGGTVGLSAVLGGVIRGCRRIIVVEPLASRRALAFELGATDVIDPHEAGDNANAALAALEPEGIDCAIDTTGREDSLKLAIDALAAGGELGLVGIAVADLPPPGEVNQMISKGLTIRGILEGDSDPQSFIPELVTLYRAGRFPFDRMITTYAFDQINQALDDQHRGSCVKAVLVCTDGRGH